MTIRDARRSDVPAMLAIYAPFVEHTAVSFEYDVPTEAEFARRLEEHQAAFPWLVCEENGRVMGYTPTPGAPSSVRPMAGMPRSRAILRRSFAAGASGAGSMRASRKF